MKNKETMLLRLIKDFWVLKLIVGYSEQDNFTQILGFSLRFKYVSLSQI